MRNTKEATQSRLNDVKSRWAKIASEKLVGKTVKRVSYLTDAECEALGWTCASVIIEFDDGSLIFPSADDEGNNAGALFTSFKDQPTFPVI